MAYTKRPVRKAPVKRRAPAKKSVAKKVSTLARTVKKLTAVSYDKLQLQMGVSGNQITSSPYFCYNITNGMNTWNPTFGVDSADISAVQKMYVNNYTIRSRLTQGSESDLITYTMFVVSLKDQANDSQTWLNSTTGALVLTPGVHYSVLPYDGTVLMNKKYFNIHKYKQFYMGGRPGDQSAPCIRDLNFSIKPKQKLVVNPGGNIFGTISGRNGLPFPRDPSQNYFYILFNDNSTIDLEDNRISIGGLASVAIAS